MHCFKTQPHGLMKMNEEDKVRLEPAIPRHPTAEPDNSIYRFVVTDGNRQCERLVSIECICT